MGSESHFSRSPSLPEVEHIGEFAGTLYVLVSTCGFRFSNKPWKKSGAFTPFLATGYDQHYLHQLFSSAMCLQVPGQSIESFRLYESLEATSRDSGPMVGRHQIVYICLESPDSIYVWESPDKLPMVYFCIYDSTYLWPGQTRHIQLTVVNWLFTFFGFMICYWCIL